MGWDDEELDTQIFDKEPTDPTRQKPPEKTEAELFFEDEDRTVATEPPPDILEQARPPGSLVTPKPEPTLSITLASEDAARADAAARREAEAAAAPPDADRASRRPRFRARPPARWRPIPTPPPARTRA